MLAVYRDPELSQHNIGMQTNLSGAMVNNYLKTMREAGVIRVGKKNKRDKVYNISKKGEQILMRALVDCSAELVQHVSKIKKILNSRLVSFFKDNNSHTVVLYGGADTAHFVLESLAGIANVSVAGIVDGDSSKWGSDLNAIPIQSPENLSQLEFDTIIICSYAHQETIYKSIAHFEQSGIHIVQLSSI